MNPLRFALILSCLVGFAAIPGCSKPGPAIATTDSDVDYYTCTMHPSVHSHDPDAKCPICGMDLVPVKKAGAQTQAAEAIAQGTDGAKASDEPHEFTIPLDRQQMIGVTYATVESKVLKRTLRAVGLVEATTAKHWDYVARVDGYIHHLNVAAPGDKVAKGQALMDLYSPDLVATESEYIDLLRMRDNGRREQNSATMQNAEHLLAGSRARLQQWNISEAQIDALEKTGIAEQYLPLNSPVDGIVAEIAVHQGRHVTVGDHLVDLVDLSSVWVWAEFYENELPLLKAGLPVTVTSSALPNLSIQGTIAVVDPFLNELKRTGRVRIDVENADFRLRPDAYVDVAVELDEGEGLAVPVDAVLPTGEHNIVFVDKGAGTLEPRYVQIGGKFGDDYRVTGGLHAGERVVSSANFLVDAESKVQGALKSW
jgi:membrane fusion protein, copper/silver efflux system